MNKKGKNRRVGEENKKGDTGEEEKIITKEKGRVGEKNKKREMGEEEIRIKGKTGEEEKRIKKEKLESRKNE